MLGAGSSERPPPAPRHTLVESGSARAGGARPLVTNGRSRRTGRGWRPGPGAARPERPRMARPENPVGREVALARSARGPRLGRPRGRSIPFSKREKLVSGKLKPGAGPRSRPGRRGCGSRAGAPPRARHVHSPGNWRRRPRRDRCRYSWCRRREPGTEGRARGAECRLPRSGRAARRTAPGRAGARRAPGWPGSRRGAPRRAAGAAGAAGPARAAAAHGAPGRGGAAWLTGWARSGAGAEPGPELGRGGGGGCGSSGGGEGCSAGPGASCSCGNRGSRATTGGACGAGRTEAGRRAAREERGVGTLPKLGVGSGGA